MKTAVASAGRVVEPLGVRVAHWLVRLFQGWCNSFTATNIESPEQANLFWRR